MCAINWPSGCTTEAPVRGGGRRGGCAPGWSSSGSATAVTTVGIIRRTEPAEVGAMNLALCYPRVLPRRGGCETYIGRLAGRLACDGHEVHLYASQWDEQALPGELRIHRVA